MKFSLIGKKEGRQRKSEKGVKKKSVERVWNTVNAAGSFYVRQLQKKKKNRKKKQKKRSYVTYHLT